MGLRRNSGPLHVAGVFTMKSKKKLNISHKCSSYTYISIIFIIQLQDRKLDLYRISFDVKYSMIKLKLRVKHL